MSTLYDNMSIEELINEIKLIKSSFRIKDCANARHYTNTDKCRKYVHEDSQEECDMCYKVMCHDCYDRLKGDWLCYKCKSKKQKNAN